MSVTSGDTHHRGYKEGEPGTSKSKGKTGDQPAQATEGAEAPPEETPPDPNPTDPLQGYTHR